jgi:hypothetical protein
LIKQIDPFATNPCGLKFTVFCFILQTIWLLFLFETSFVKVFKNKLIPTKKKFLKYIPCHPATTDNLAFAPPPENFIPALLYLAQHVCELNRPSSSLIAFLFFQNF